MIESSKNLREEVMSTKVYKVSWHSGDVNGDDSAWDKAEVLDDFCFPWLDESAPRTVFRSVWNSDHFHFKFNVTDTDLVLASGVDAKERVMGSDRAEIFISTGPELKPYYGLEIDPRGQVLSYRGEFQCDMDWNWTCSGLRTTASYDENGYVVEGSMPMSTLKQMQCLHEDDEGQYMTAGLFRGEFSHGDNSEVVENWIAWVDPNVKQPNFHVPSAFGKLRLLKP